MAFLEIRDLIYTYPGSGVRAVDGLSLDASRGEIVAVVGPNAAGKSTLARLLKGLIQPDSGMIRIDGRERETTGPVRDIGILFSNPENQLVTSILEEDVAFGLEVIGEPSRVIERKVETVLDRLGILHLRKRMPHLMSGGEQQMAALAGVLVLDPHTLILDEPTTYLDPVAKEAVMASIRGLAEEGRVVILITHDMREASKADRVILIDQGRVALEGRPEEVFGQPGLAGRFGITPPFLMRLVLGMRSMGREMAWPPDREAFGRAFGERPWGRGGSEGRGLRVRGVPGAKAALAFENIHFRYGEGAAGSKPVLEGVDFSVERGSIALVCGSNGSGKSTLLQMSNGLVEPDRGLVLLEGLRIREWRKKPGGVPGRVALLFQNPEHQVFAATVYEDVAFGPRNMGVNARQINERVRKAIRWAGLPETVLERAVHTLSGGQMRRVAVAGVLAMEPRVLVLDEPTDGLDPGGAREFYAGARQYCDDTGTAIVMATHALPEEIDRVDHLGHLSGGRIRSSGPPFDVLTGPARTLPANFLPEHLLLRAQLLDAGSTLLEDVLDAESTLKRLLEHSRPQNSGGGF